MKPPIIEVEGTIGTLGRSEEKMTLTICLTGDFFFYATGPDQPELREGDWVRAKGIFSYERSSASLEEVDLWIELQSIERMGIT